MLIRHIITILSQSLVSACSSEWLSRPSQRHVEPSCSLAQLHGYDWHDVPAGDLFQYDGCVFSGWQVVSSGDLTPYGNSGVANRSCIASDLRRLPLMRAPNAEVFSVSQYLIRTGIDQVVEFEYGFENGSICREFHQCSSLGSLVENTQCGTASSVRLKPVGDVNTRYDVEIYNIGFSCAVTDLDLMKHDALTGTIHSHFGTGASIEDRVMPTSDAAPCHLTRSSTAPSWHNGTLSGTSGGRSDKTLMRLESSPDDHLRILQRCLHLAHWPTEQLAEVSSVDCDIDSLERLLGCIISRSQTSKGATFAAALLSTLCLEGKNSEALGSYVDSAVLANGSAAASHHSKTVAHGSEGVAGVMAYGSEGTRAADRGDSSCHGPPPTTWEEVLETAWTPNNVDAIVTHIITLTVTSFVARPRSSETNAPATPLHPAPTPLRSLSNRTAVSLNKSSDTTRAACVERSGAKSLLSYLTVQSVSAAPQALTRANDSLWTAGGPSPLDTVAYRSQGSRYLTPTLHFWFGVLMLGMHVIRGARHL